MNTTNKPVNGQNILVKKSDLNYTNHTQIITVQNTSKRPITHLKYIWTNATEKANVNTITDHYIDNVLITDHYIDNNVLYRHRVHVMWSQAQYTSFFTSTRPWLATILQLIGTPIWTSFFGSWRILHVFVSVTTKRSVSDKNKGTSIF